VFQFRFITFKEGQNRDRVLNSGQFSVPGDLVIFSGQAVKIRDCPSKIRMDGHLTTDPIRNVTNAALFAGLVESVLLWSRGDPFIVILQCSESSVLWWCVNSLAYLHHCSKQSRWHLAEKDVEGILRWCDRGCKVSYWGELNTPSGCWNYFHSFHNIVCHIIHHFICDLCIYLCFSTAVPCCNCNMCFFLFHMNWLYLNSLRFHGACWFRIFIVFVVCWV